jgi:hypothetical protein
MIFLVILALYLILILVYVLISFFIVYHLVKFSAEGELKYVMLIVFVFISIGLIFANVTLFFSIDWNTLTKNLLI